MVLVLHVLVDMTTIRQVTSKSRICFYNCLFHFLSMCLRGRIVTLAALMTKNILHNEPKESYSRFCHAL